MSKKDCNIYLSGEDAKRFYHDMTHIDPENQERINKYFKRISQIELSESKNGGISAKFDFLKESINKIKSLKE